MNWLREKLGRIRVGYVRYRANISIVIIFFCFVVISVIGLAMIAETRAQGLKIEEQNRKIEILTRENKKISQQNQELNKTTIFLADRNIYYSKCIATIIARFTQNTSRPIKINDITKCEVAAGNVQQRALAYDEPTQQPSAPSKSDAKKPDKNNSSTDNPSPDTPSPITGIPLVDGIIKTLGG